MSESQPKIAKGTNGILLHQARVLLLLDKHEKWGFAGGTFDDAIDDSLEACCVREVGEETGIIIKPSELRPIYAYSSITNSPRKGHSKYLSDYYYYGHTSEMQCRLSEEHISSTWHSMEGGLELLPDSPDRFALQALLTTLHITGN